jgi:nucleotide-binding universal stress UspA family protein
MYKHILVPTDGTKLSRKAIVTAVRMASLLDARVTGVFAIPPYSPVAYGEGVVYAPPGSRDAYLRSARKEARKALAVLEIEARIAGVGCAVAIVSGAMPWEGILRAARSRKCDLIVMASHGRRGLAGLLLGSETTKVLTHSKTPVLVCR